MKKIIYFFLITFFISTQGFAQAGNALNFGGEDDRVIISNVVLSSPYTIETWLNIDPNALRDRIFVADGTGEIYCDSHDHNRGIRFTVLGVELNTANNIFNYGEWIHVGIVVTAANTKIYINGTEKASGSLSNTDMNATNFYLGGNSNGFFNLTGYMDEFRIWSTARTQTQIQDNMNTTVDPSTTGLYAYYRFDQGTAGGNNAGVTTLEDLTSNNKDGTLQNFALTGSTSNWISSVAPLPVELSSFNASIINNTVKLNWQTATEVNNYGFEIERRQVGNRQLTIGNQSQWERIGFVKGNGNSNSPKSYEFVDDKLSAGKYLYRLKQIDTEGIFEYSIEIETEIGSAPMEFNLAQNYPNPFNPETMIEFTLPENGTASLKIYNSLGEEVTELFNEFAEAGKYHRVRFDGSTLSSGIYYARLQFSDKQMMKKMLYLK